MDSKPTIALKDLEGKPGITTAHFAESRAVVIRIVGDGRTATAAGDDGAMNVWRDKKAVLHAAFYRNRVTENHAKTLTLADLAVWLKKWWPELGRGRSSRQKKKEKTV